MTLSRVFDISLGCVLIKNTPVIIAQKLWKAFGSPYPTPWHEGSLTSCKKCIILFISFHSNNLLVLIPSRANCFSSDRTEL